MKRVKGVTVTPHYCPIQDKDAAWYKQFQVIVMGLDSIEARRWLNAMACSLVTYETDEAGQRKPDLTCARPSPRPRADQGGVAPQRGTRRPRLPSRSCKATWDRARRSRQAQPTRPSPSPF